ncbi:S-formylglutathione hydrolase [Nitrosomonas cryotolerans]|uniref:S-formylglutathione hydrolase n=1 Tax=Nitrosomonas cryotolerans ATCC 49181 TaxID=1131553 RepID=A0A1N6J7Q3_9PROT|nr:S-formylglutathione hydrolase [Nitrosomonas cryotolerans]SFP44736.1 S-formylglutathione hydrolase [Nitrosomonas cryotolerans]SIO40374.1 S-formylglutathione hydrolase [Nitrosomonas cryotolerans ATCC 49181]
MKAVLETVSQHRCFDGMQGFYQHHSEIIGLPMRFSVYQPPQAQYSSVPVLFFLAGLTCTEETFMIKAGAQRYAAKYGLMLVTMDTSPRQTGLPGESVDWDLGAGAGFYLDATVAPWSQYYRMETYITQELREIVLAQFPADKDRIGIFGHSMGGHGALTLALRNPEIYQSVSAFAPVSSPMSCPWGQKAFTHYLGETCERWRGHDATALIEDGCHHASLLLIDQGLDDPFLSEQLHPDRLEMACKKAKQKLILRYHEGYDHGYYFISTYIADHLRHHRDLLNSSH